MVERDGKYVYDYERAGLTVDVALFETVAGKLSVVLIRRRGEPYAGSWALPGGYMEIDETLEAAARRELLEETALVAGPMEELGAYDAIDRDPRGRTITIAYLGLGVENADDAVAGDDASDVRWFPLDELPAVAFDHGQIIADALARLRSRRP